MSVSWHHTEIWLATANVKSYFRTLTLHPDGCGVFGFVLPFMKMFFVSTAMVFGYVASANCWEPFCQAMEIMTAVYFKQFTGNELVHREYIDMLKFDEPMEGASNFTPAFHCSLNPGSCDENGRQTPIQSRIYVDKSLLAAPWVLMKLYFDL